MMTLVASALAGGYCIDDADALRTGGTAGAIGCVVKTPSTLGTFLRSFSWGHIRQLNRVSRELLARALGCRCRTWRRAADHRPGLHHLRDLWSGQGGGPPPRLHRPAGLSPAAGRGRRHWRGAARLREGRANTVRGAARFLRETVGRVRYGGTRGQLRCGPTGLLHPRPGRRLP